MLCGCRYYAYMFWFVFFVSVFLSSILGFVHVAFFYVLSMLCDGVWLSGCFL